MSDLLGDEKDSFVKFERSKLFRFLSLFFITKRFGMKNTMCCIRKVGRIKIEFLLKIEILSHDLSGIQRTPRIHFDSICKYSKQKQAFRKQVQISALT